MPHSRPVVIQTERLYMRRPTIKDVETMFPILSNPLSMKYGSSLPHTTLEQSQEWVEGMIEEPDDYLIELRPVDTTDNRDGNEQRGRRSKEVRAAKQGQKGLVIGKIGCWQGNEIGFMLHPDYWRNGYMSEAFEGYLEYLRQIRPEYGTLTADVDPRNEASLSFLKKQGFEVTGTKEQTFCLGGEWCDSVYLSRKINL